VAEERRRLAAIMFTDMVGYSARAQADEAGALALLDRHNHLLRPIFTKFRGREVKTVGDAFVVEFESALDATRCALDIQRMLHYYNLRSSEPWRILIRIGIHVGDVVETGGDVLGDSVNIAARIVTLAGPEGVCLTQQVYDQVANKAASTGSSPYGASRRPVGRRRPPQGAGSWPSFLSLASARTPRTGTSRMGSPRN